MNLVRIHLRYLVHVIIQHGDMRVVIRSPDLHLVKVGCPDLCPFRRVTGHLPVGHTIDAVGIRIIFISPLQPVPHKILQVIFYCINLLLIREIDVLGSHIRRLAKARIIACQHIPPPSVKAIGVVRPAEDAVFHVICRKETIVPFGCVTVLSAVDNK